MTRRYARAEDIMTQLSFRNLAWLALVLAAGCGETSDPGVCEDVTCGANASCSAGACACEEGFVGDPRVGCTAAETCTEMSCSGHGTCDASSGSVVCTCEEGYTGATCLGCAEGYERKDDACVPVDLCEDVDCGDHGTCVVDGTASCDCDDGYKGASCDQCADGYRKEGALCVFDDKCETVSCGTNETCVVTGGAAACECAEGFTSENGACINQKWVDCVDAAPTNATSVDEQKQVIWNAASQKWSSPGACNWNCNLDYFETEGGRCINTRTVDCDASGTKPEFSSFVEVQVTVAYTTAGGWPDAPVCEWVCEGDRAREGGACVSEKYVDCLPSGVENADDIVVQQLLTYTAAGGWTQPDVCAWACKTDYVDFEDNGVCINERQVQCDPTDVVVPANAEIDLANVTITYTTAGGWSDAACGWKCLPAFGQVGDECLDEKQVDCDGSNPPPNKAPVVAQVTVAWNEAQQAWDAPAACEFECAPGFDDYDDDGSCENTFSVLCDPASTPLNASAAEEVMVDITFDGADWSAPGACPWTCDDDFYEKSGACLERTIVNSCLLVDTALETTPGAAVEVAGYVDFTGAGVIARLCVARPSFAAPVSLGDLDCFDAVYKDEDTVTQQYFVAQASKANVGEFEYVYAFSGDEGGTWTLCDLGGAFDPVTGPSEPGILTVRKGINEQIADVRAAKSKTPVDLPVEGALVTYVRAQVGNELAGFFVQGSQLGPALFVVRATNPPAVGSRVNFRVTEIEKNSREQILVTKYTEPEAVGTGNPEDFVQELSAATDVVTGLGGYDNELVRMTGTIASGPQTAGTDYTGLKFVTAGVDSTRLQLRMPTAVYDSLSLELGCEVTVTGPMWRFNDTAQPSAEVAADLSGYDCPGPKVTEAKATNQTTVVVTFDKDIDGSRLGAVEEHFETDPPLEIQSMTVVDNKVTLTTAAQVEDEEYTLTVSNVFDLMGNALEEDFSTWTFIGRGETTSVCDWDGTGSPVLITQVHGGTTPFDFVELFNRSDEPVSIDGWSLQYASSGGDFPNNVQLTPLSGTIAPGRFHLVGLKGASSSSTPKPDSIGTQDAAQASGKFALVSSTTAIGSGTTATCWDKPTVMDFVGYGSTATCYEGGKAPAPSKTTAIIRTDVCVDANNNATEFKVVTPAPRNSEYVP